MTHKYGVGQIVDLLHRPLRAAVGGEYEIRRLMPTAEDGNSEDPSYRIKSIAEKHERVAPESELTLSEPQHVFSSSADQETIVPAAPAVLAERLVAPQIPPSPAQIHWPRPRDQQARRKPCAEAAFVSSALT